MRRSAIVSILVLSSFSVGLGGPASAAIGNGRIVYQKYPLSGPERIVSILPDGSDPELSFIVGNYWSLGYRMALSPDGTRLLLAQSHQSRDGSVYLSRLVTVDAVDGGNPTVVIPPADSFFASVAWYPDGSRLLFTMALFGGANDGRYRLYSSLPDGSDLAQIGTRVRIDATMSPDMTQIAFRDGKERLGVMDSDGSNPVFLIENGRNFYPRWSPDGSRIAFTRQDGDLWTIEPDGSDLVRIVETPKRWESSPAWSPDGTRLLFLRVKSFSESDLWTIAADGSDPVRVTDDRANEFWPVWAPA